MRMGFAGSIIFRNQTILNRNPVAMSTIFTFAKGYEDGFDWFHPPWLMVGIDRHRHVQLLDGPDLHLHTTNPEVATAKFLHHNESKANERVISITGHGKGVAHIEARHGHHSKARLHVSVYPRRGVKVNFYRVKEISGQVPIFNSSMVQGLTKQINHLHKHQSNLRFESHLVHNEVPIDLDFTTPNQSANDIQHIWDVLKKKCQELDNSPSHFHVFWVKTWGAKDTKCNGQKTRDVIGTASDIGGHMCVMEDVHDAHKQGLLLAHELGHCLNAHHDKERESALMFPISKGGHKIYRFNVEEIRGHLDA